MAKSAREDEPDGLLVVDKPAGVTSHDVVAQVRRLAGTRKVGHAGTLDPMATGVLLLGLGRGTKLLTFLVGCDKTYDATIRLGQATVTDDAEGEVVSSSPVAELTPEIVSAAVARLTGEIQQVPSAVSAIKVDGQRSYARVRAGETVELPARPVTVSRFEIHDQRVAGEVAYDLDVSVDVSSGTYVRALARDLGASLGVGGHLTALRRTRVGGYDLTRALVPAPVLLEHDAALARVRESDPEVRRLPRELLPPLPLLDLATAARAQFPVHELTDDEVRAVGHGQRVPSALVGTPVVAAFAPDGRLVAILDETRAQARSHVVLAPA
ncbi:tRNA pseudouridine(55) synthase TruB [Arsenicicoccus dermatophilus]|uniref:tRNA pseudouridine(55) synthase TruB n=1 Tax=Arsenicicoccus dermatophilus TaxID=1076331 RepID=UPI001F4CFBCA|nr:tRNA pseudouridine(55) synthase TruB [Arsenicicoccus dermatophilus]MCH8613335.1 tRNA pseudouridine(55) synthase TruB [Arsenicicoccus dermatophilus]